MPTITTSQGTMFITGSRLARDGWEIAGFGQNLVTSGEETFPRMMASFTTGTLGNQLLRLSFFTARETETITSIRVDTTGTAAGATPTLIRFGIYSVDSSSGDITLVASTPNDTTLLAATNTRYTKALSASFNKVAGTRYAVGGLVVTAAAAPTVSMCAVPVPEAGEAPRVTASVSGQADLPASVAAGSLTNVTNSPYFQLVP